MKLVVLTGIPGSGSTTVLKKTLEEVDYLHLNYGDIMTEIAVEKGLVENRDELRKLPADTQKEIQKEAGLRIKERSESENVIVDTHCTISTPAGFLPLILMTVRGKRMCPQYERCVLRGKFPVLWNAPAAARVPIYGSSFPTRSPALPPGSWAAHF